MALIPVTCPSCRGRTSLPVEMLDVATVAGTEAHPTCRWRCRHCEQSVVILLSDPEYRLLAKQSTLRLRNVTAPIVDQPRWSTLEEEEVIAQMAEIHENLQTVQQREEA